VSERVSHWRACGEFTDLEGDRAEQALALAFDS
jgi:hypothetical protein